MPEVMFVLKSFVIAIIVMACMQIKIGQTSIEESAHHWIQTSLVTAYLQDVSSGAVLAVRNAATVTKNFLAKTFGNDQSSQKAGRFNFEFKRSQQYQKEQSEKED
jgi:hypothetical protein